jgi:hypothetical protein
MKLSFSFNTCHFVLLVAATLARTSVAGKPIDLGAACGFAVLSKSGISTVPNSVITGDIGVSPIAAAAMTGFSLTADASTAFSTSTQVDGQCLAANYGGATPATMTAAISAMEAAFTEGSSRVATYASNLGGGTIGDKTLYSGVYEFTVKITIDLDVTFDAQDDPNAVFIVKTTDQLFMAAGKNVILKNGARADNIFWHAMGGIQVNAGAHMEGNLLSATTIDFITGSSLNGRALAQTAIALQMATITKPAGCGEKAADPFLVC